MGIEKFIQKVCVQTAVYWGNPQPDGYGGITFDAPVEIGCRWEDKTQIIVNNQGKEMISKAEVLVTQDLDVQGRLYLGSISELESDPVPMEVEGAFEIKAFNKIPMIRKTDVFVRKVYL